MGGSSWSDDHYQSRSAQRAATNTPTFAHHVAVQAGTAATVLHPSLNVKGVKVRESRDSAAHPNSRAVAVLLDVTGSMQTVPQMIQAKLPTLMGLLIRKSYLADPHILVGAIGDANSDQVPVQIGQFEAGIEIDDNISNIFMEGNGGGQNHETYELALWFMANRTFIDCFEKRGQKGFLFVIGDEMFYPIVKREQIAEYLGDPPEANVSSEEVFAKLKEQYEVFFIMPKMTSHFGDASFLAHWRKQLGEHVLLLEDPSGICELIASTIALYEGVELSSVSKDLADEGTSAITVASVSRSLATYAASTGDKATSLSIPSSGSATGLAEI